MSFWFVFLFDTILLFSYQNDMACIVIIMLKKLMVCKYHYVCYQAYTMSKSQAQRMKALSYQMPLFWWTHQGRACKQVSSKRTDQDPTHLQSHFGGNVPSIIKDPHTLTRYAILTLFFSHFSQFFWYWIDCRRGFSSTQTPIVHPFLHKNFLNR